MAGSVRSLFTRLLPWAALGVLTVAFFVQVKARREAEREADVARAGLAPLRKELALSEANLAFIPSARPAAVADVAGEHVAEISDLRRKLELAHEELAASRAAERARTEKGDRTESLRATEAARANALAREAGAAQAEAATRVATAQAETSKAQADAARRIAVAHTSEQALAARLREVTTDESRLDVALTGLLKAKDAGVVKFAIEGLVAIKHRGYAGRVLPLLDHDAPTVRIAAMHALLRSGSGVASAAPLCEPVLRLLADDAPDIRLAGLLLAQEVVGETPSLGFGSKDPAVAKEIARLKTKLAALARE